MSSLGTRDSSLNSYLRPDDVEIYIQYDSRQFRSQSDHELPFRGAWTSVYFSSM